jgi:hypothetical protein
MDNYYKCKPFIAEIYKLKIPFDVIIKYIRPRLCTFIDMNGYTNEQLYKFIEVFIMCHKALDLKKKYNIQEICHTYLNNNYSKEFDNTIHELIDFNKNTTLMKMKINEYCKKNFQRPYYKLKRAHMINLINAFNIPFVHCRELITPYRKEPKFIKELENLIKGYKIENKEFCITLLDNTTINVKINNTNYIFSSVNKLVTIDTFWKCTRIPINEFIYKFIIGI